MICADDMAYGDLHCQNPDSKIPTPNLDRLAGEGMRFTDAHSSSGICSPSRFALLTGQYHWRRAHNIVESFGPPMFKDGDITLPQVFKDAGYATACIGKWHLGWNFNFLHQPSAELTCWGKTQKVYFPGDIDWNSPLTGIPLDRGFDYYFGDGTVNFPPYAWVGNDRFLERPADFFEFNQFASEPKEGEWDSHPTKVPRHPAPHRVGHSHHHRRGRPAPRRQRRQRRLPNALFEIKIINGFENTCYPDGMAGAVSGQTPPLVTVCKKPGDWQSFDIIFKAPVFMDRQLATPATVTVLQNDVLVQNHTAILGGPHHNQLPNPAAHADKMPIVLQNHGQAVRFRNIWVRPL